MPASRPVPHSVARARSARLLLSLGLAVVARPTRVDAQRTIRSEVNAWLDVTSDVWLTPTIGLQGEALVERAERARVPQQTELRLGVQRALGPSVRLAVGGTFIHTSPYGPFPARAPFDERRTWVQATVEQRFTKLVFAHRYRLEERWIERPSATGGASDYAFALRFRYQARATIPLAPATRPRGPYLAASDEIFLVAGPHASNNLVDQNRAYAGIGLRWSPMLRGEIGYLNQAILRANGTQVENNHTLQLSLNVARAAKR
jgi:hypothetical protein